jgi:hypothetical protein
VQHHHADIGYRARQGGGARAWLAAAVLCAAACGTSDADRIDEFVKAVSGEVSAAR